MSNPKHTDPYAKYINMTSFEDHSIKNQLKNKMRVTAEIVNTYLTPQSGIELENSVAFT